MERRFNYPKAAPGTYRAMLGLEQYLRDCSIEESLLPLGARPHWGKVFTMQPARVVQRYERAEDFRRLMDEFDPAGKFRNAYIEELFPTA